MQGIQKNPSKMNLNVIIANFYEGFSRDSKQKNKLLEMHWQLEYMIVVIRIVST
jgi:hypothetical protein